MLAALAGCDDDANRRAAATFADTEPPTVEITGPAEGAIFGEQTITVTGTASDDSSV